MHVVALAIEDEVAAGSKWTGGWSTMHSDDAVRFRFGPGCGGCSRQMLQRAGRLMKAILVTADPQAMAWPQAGEFGVGRGGRTAGSATSSRSTRSLRGEELQRRRGQFASLECARVFRTAVETLQALRNSSVGGGRDPIARGNCRHRAETESGGRPMTKARGGRTGGTSDRARHERAVVIQMVPWSGPGGLTCTAAASVPGSAARW